ncbi:MAG: competence/damage-inducible protein A [Phycisphaeraceae bacterium]|nr:competence/damage-inducible protein A [Phycisphaeraceae bacterium]
MRTILVSIGDELVLGQTVESNGAYMAEQLCSLGAPAVELVTVGDDQQAITQTLRRCAADADLLIVTGGLGPTADDLTRQALAEAMGVKLIENAVALQQIEKFFRGRHKPMPKINRVQALCPRGAQVLENPAGTAPGIAAKLQRAQVFVLPGVPREMQVMFQQHVRPHIVAAISKPALFTASIHCFGQGESTIAERLGKLMARDHQPDQATVGTTVSAGVCTVRLRANDQDTLEKTAQQVQILLGPVVFGRDGITLPQALLDLLQQKQLTLATAESCTGGLLGKLLTDTPGSSAVYLGGWITYSNDMKQRHLDVAPDWLEGQGAVSGPVVCAMASHAADRSGADCALAISGIAGPDGGSAQKPVGTVWIGLHVRRQSPPTQAFVCLFPAAIGREAIRDRAAKMALQALRLRLLDQPLDMLDWTPGSTAPGSPASATTNEQAPTTT